MYQIHPISMALPRMPKKEFADLKNDIRENGLIEPIWLYEGMVLDGRHRYYACQETGVTAAFRDYVGCDPIRFAKSVNFFRRNLSKSQKAMAAAKMANMPRGGIREGQNTLASQTANLRVEVSQSEAAEMFEVSERSVQTAAMIEREAPAEVAQAVLDGAISLNLAAQVAELPAEAQQTVAAAAPEEITEAAREAVHNHRAQGTGENEWYTPEQYIEAARELLGEIDVDPASSELAQKTVKAGRFFTIEDNGLEKEWNGKVWLNPPYAQPAIQDFIRKTVAEFEAGRMSEGVVLTHNYTDTKWFHIAAKAASAICFTRGRIGFLSPEGKKAAPTQGQAFFYFGSRREDFADSFCGFGFVMVKP